MSYAAFKVDIDSWLARDDVAVTGVSIDSIVTLAEAALSRDAYGVMQSRSATLSINARSISVPSDFRSMIALYIDQTTTKIDYQTPEMIRLVDAWNDGGQTLYYTIESDTNGNPVFTFAPAGDPSNPTPAVMQYWSGLPSIITNGTNSLFVNAYDLYLFATLRECGSWLQEETIEARYDGRYNAALQRYNLAEQRKRYGGNAKVITPPPGVIV